MRKFAIAAIAVSMAVTEALAAYRGAGFELGAGATYWYSIDEAKDQSFDRDGLGWMLSSRIPLSDFFAIGLEVEQSPDNFVFLDKHLYLPSAYAILGDGIYGAIGLGTYYYDGDFYGDVWYALRAGFKVPILANSLVLDVNVNYRVENWDGIKDATDNVDTDTLMIGAALRLVF